MTTQMRAPTSDRRPWLSRSPARRENPVGGIDPVARRLGRACTAETTAPSATPPVARAGSVRSAAWPPGRSSACPQVRRYSALPSLLEGAGGVISSGVRGNWAAAAAWGGRSS
jgi:hypothetical protein